MKVVLIGLLLLLGLSPAQAEDISGPGLRVSPNIWSDKAKPLDLSLPACQKFSRFEKVPKMPTDTRYGASVTPVGALPVAISLLSGAGVQEALRTYRGSSRVVAGISYVY